MRTIDVHAAPEGTYDVEVSEVPGVGQLLLRLEKNEAARLREQLHEGLVGAAGFEDISCRVSILQRGDIFPDLGRVVERVIPVDSQDDHKQVLLFGGGAVIMHKECEVTVRRVIA